MKEQEKIKLGRPKKEKTTLIRLPIRLINDIRIKLPNEKSDSARFTNVYDMSIIKYKESVDKMGKFVYGKYWKKVK